ncbi:TIGR04540 family protein [Paenibacillus sp. T1]|uniref:TIGR04540 family protein n=1 Tax=Paenibacillus glycinis TaxID=2697035 RepID=A0ABW9XSJ1_9BACL|nr:TIGR04540 family protein [Paenibacillus glycinis]
MEVKLFYKTQRDLANSVNQIVDAYWCSDISEDDFIRHVSAIYLNNSNKIIKQNGFTTILKQQCGKRRLDVIERILKLNGFIHDTQSTG